MRNIADLAKKLESALFDELDESFSVCEPRRYFRNLQFAAEGEMQNLSTLNQTQDRYVYYSPLL